MLGYKTLTRLRNGLSLTTFQRYKSDVLPELTQLRYTVKRGNYAELNGKDISFFESLIGTSNYSWLKPGSTQEISEILKYCNDRRLAVCPQGGNTGVVGGAVPVFDEIVLSLGRLNKIISIDDITGITACESGCILENLDAKTREAGLVVPVDLGAKASCHIGGNVSTNAGGLRVLRYGNFHGNVLGVEAVLANGQVLDLMSDFKKDNTGYHLKHLFIGSEGTLGVVTKVALLCPTVSDSVNLAFLGLNSFDNVLQTFKNAKRNLGEILSSCELIDAKSLEATCEHFNLKSPIEGFPFYMLIETSGSNSEHDLEKLNNFLQFVMEKGDVLDGTCTGEPSKMQEMWKIRELIALALMKDGYCFNYDVSLPLRNFYDIVGVLEKRLGNLATRVTGFGHLGDSNLHLNVSCEQYTDELYKLLEPFVYEFTSQLKGSISAEHGIGFLKKNYVKYSKNPAAIEMMRK
ncbi:hypothetical protein DOY81_011524 [Sarcophaga bullata]|nr:hypothetical protein DOY81_011524 [Sarcophaga bullata]